MNRQQLADILLSHWQLLWPLPAAERWAVIEETRLDYEYSEQMYCVEKEMSDVEV